MNPPRSEKVVNTNGNNFKKIKEFFESFSVQIPTSNIPLCKYTLCLHREVCIAVALQKMSRLFERWNDLWLSEELIAAIYFYSQSDNGPIYFHTPQRHFKVLVSCSDLKWHFHLGFIFMCIFGGWQGTIATLLTNVPDEASYTLCNSWRCME